MKWTILSLACAALVSATGCCCSRACGPCGGYGASFAPSPSSCPGGQCGPMYQSGAVIPGTQQAYIPATQQAFVPATQSAYVPYTTTASLDYLPMY